MASYQVVWLLLLLLLLVVESGHVPNDDEFFQNILKRIPVPKQILPIIAAPSSPPYPEAEPIQWYSSTRRANSTVPANESAAYARGKWTLTQKNTQDPLEGLVSLSGQAKVTLFPQSLEFGPRQACVASVLKFEIKNSHPLEELQILNIKTDDVQFHPAMFRPKSLAPGEFTHIQLIFLPHGTGPVDGKAVIQTSSGSIIYPLSGIGIANRYELHGFQANVSAGQHYDPMIRMTNPTDKPLMIEEIFTTEGFLHLSLPNEDKNVADSRNTDSSSLQWQIQARDTQDVMRLSFMSRVSGEFTGFVYVKTDAENMILPIQINVLTTGLILSQQTVDFGVLVSADECHEIDILMTNTANKAIHISGIQLDYPSPNLSVMLNSKTTLQAAETGILKLLLDGAVEGIRTGVLTIQTDDKDSVDIQLPYLGRIMHGSLSYYPEEALFNQSDRRNLTIINRFAHPLRIEKIEMLGDQSECVMEGLFDTVVEASASHQAWIIQVNCELNSTDTHLRFSSLEISTNVTFHRIDLHVHFNRLLLRGENVKPLALNTEDQDEYEVEFGYIATRDFRQSMLNISNPSAAAITIQAIDRHKNVFKYLLVDVVPDLTCSPEVYQLAMAFHATETFAKKKSIWGQQLLNHHLQPRDQDETASVDSFDFVLPPGHVAILSFQVQTINLYQPQVVDNLALSIQTPDQLLRLYGKFETKVGEVRAVGRRLRYSPSFPGFQQYMEVELENSFDVNVTITGARMTSPMAKILVQNFVLPANSVKSIGAVEFTPAFGCSNAQLADCFAGKRRKDPNLSDHGDYISASDIDAHTARVTLFEEETKRDRFPYAMAIKLNTDVMAQVNIDVDGKGMRPTLASALDFGTVEIGTMAQGYISVHNVGTMVLTAGLATLKHTKHLFRCSRNASQLILQRQAECMQKWQDLLALNQTSKVFYIPPFVREHTIQLKKNESTLIGPIYYFPLEHASYDTVFYIRNNYTHIEPVDIGGKGEYTRMNLVTERSTNVILVHDFEPITETINIVNVGNLSVAIPIDKMEVLTQHTGFKIASTTPGIHVLNANERLEIPLQYQPQCMYKVSSVAIRVHTAYEMYTIDLAMQMDDLLTKHCETREYNLQLSWLRSVSILCACGWLVYECLRHCIGTSAVPMAAPQLPEKVNAEHEKEKAKMLDNLIASVDKKLQRQPLDAAFEGSAVRTLRQKRQQLSSHRAEETEEEIALLDDQVAEVLQPVSKDEMMEETPGPKEKVPIPDKNLLSEEEGEEEDAICTDVPSVDAIELPTDEDAMPTEEEEEEEEEEITDEEVITSDEEVTSEENDTEMKVKDAVPETVYPEQEIREIMLTEEVPEEKKRTETEDEVIVYPGKQADDEKDWEAMMDSLNNLVHHKIDEEPAASVGDNLSPLMPWTTRFQRYVPPPQRTATTVVAPPPGFAPLEQPFVPIKPAVWSSSLGAIGSHRRNRPPAAEASPRLLETQLLMTEDTKYSNWN